MISMKDIARRCGVSVGTVSKALNDRGDVGEATKQRILETARELGYTANSAARALKTNRTYSIGIVFTDLSHSGFMHEYFASTLNSFRQEAERCGYDITFISENMGPANTSYLQHVRYRGLDGVAVICADFFDPQIQELIYSDLPVISLDHAFNNRAAVLSDNMRGMETIVHYVYGRGHRRIAYIHGNHTAVTESRMTGFYRACEELGLRIPDEYIAECEYHEPISCYKATKQLLALPERPTCILFSDDYAYIGGSNAILEEGLRVPEDISIVGYDGIHMAKMVGPKLTTWQQNSEELGRIAAEQLIERIEHPRTTLPRHITVEGRLLEGETVRQLG
ncbi:MAG: LacI family DNA-binding transcriptional regulator [Oscillospiraceae bacterium]|nr:LacI family DNA-binding transcriptional regulator [Oscillospiraceae bacterium]